MCQTGGGQLGGGSLPPVVGKVGVGLGLVEFEDLSVVEHFGRVIEVEFVVAFFGHVLQENGCTFWSWFCIQKIAVVCCCHSVSLSALQPLGYGSLFERRRRGIRYLRNMEFRWLRCESEQFWKVIKPFGPALGKFTKKLMIRLME